jgi:hypothetical protein
MEAMRESRTDARLDEFAAHTDRRFDSLERRMDDGFTRVDADLRGLRQETNDRFDALQRTLLQISRGVIATLIAGFAGLIATQL